MVWIILILFLALSAALIYFMFKINSNINERLKESSDALRDTQKDIGGRLEVFGKIQQSLGRIDAMNEKILEVSKDITGLQDLLKPPKLRGGVGETLLENILSQIFSGREEFYSFQHKFKDGVLVDAIIKVGNHLVPVDAKFPLEDFQRIQEAKSEEEKTKLRKEFGSRIKNRIDETAKYIKPSEGTFDFALMYIPSEAIYYEIINNSKIWDYAISKNVISVSANSLFPYLQVITKGLKGLIIEKNIKEVINNLKSVSLELNKFSEDFRKVGSHLSDAMKKFNDSEKRLTRFNDRLEDITSIDSKKLENKS